MPRLLSNIKNIKYIGPTYLFYENNMHDLTIDGHTKSIYVWIWNNSTNTSAWLSWIVGSNTIWSGKNYRKSGNFFCQILWEPWCCMYVYLRVFLLSFSCIWADVIYFAILVIVIRIKPVKTHLVLIDVLCCEFSHGTYLEALSVLRYSLLQ